MSLPEQTADAAHAALRAESFVPHVVSQLLPAIRAPTEERHGVASAAPEAKEQQSTELSGEVLGAAPQVIEADSGLQGSHPKRGRLVAMADGAATFVGEVLTRWSLRGYVKHVADALWREKSGKE